MLQDYDDNPIYERNHNEFLATPKDQINGITTFVRELFLISHKSRDARKYLRSHASINYEKRRHLLHHSHAIHPFSLFSHWWTVLMIFTTGFALIAFPYQAAFDMERDDFWWSVVKNIVIVFSCGDIIIKFLTGYFDKYDSVVELKLKKIILHYAKRSFIFDFLGAFPTDILFSDTLDHYIVAREVTSLVFGFRFFSFLTYSNRIAKYYDVPRTLYDFFNTLIWLTVVIHWQACLYWIVPAAVASMTYPKQPGNESWISSTGLWSDPSDFNRYSNCVLRAIITLMHSGFLLGTEALNVEDQYLVVTFNFLDVVLFCFLVARVMQLFKGINSSKLKYQAALAHLSQYMSHKQLPRKTQDRIVNYYEFRFQRSFFRETEILSTLSMHMRQEIRMHSCRKLVENVTFFNNLPISLLSRIVSLLKSEIYLMNDLIVKADQTGDCMYFIASGTVAVYTSSGKEVCHLDDGAHFGEIALVMQDSRRVASVVAIETCKLYKLIRADFARTIHPYPMLWERIKKIAIERHEKTSILNAQ